MQRRKSEHTEPYRRNAAGGSVVNPRTHAIGCPKRIEREIDENSATIDIKLKSEKIYFKKEEYCDRRYLFFSTLFCCENISQKGSKNKSSIRSI